MARPRRERRGSARLWTATLLALAAGIALATRALAQSTGGSFGGGDFSDTGGGGGGYDDDDWGHGGGGVHGAMLFMRLVLFAFHIHPAFGFLVLILGLVVVVAGGVRSSGRRGYDGGGPDLGAPRMPNAAQVLAGLPSPQSRAWNNADVTMVRLALDASARPALEAELSRLWASTDWRLPDGLARTVRAVAMRLRAHEAAWRLGGESNFHPMSPPQAEGVYRQLAERARASLAASDAVAATLDPGAPDRVFVVTLVVAARREIVDFQGHRPEQVRMILDDLARLGPKDLVAAEISWLPTSAGASLATADLARVMPELRPIERLSVSGGAKAGFCGWCGKPRAAGVARCPHCGGGPT